MQHIKNWQIILMVIVLAASYLFLTKASKQNLVAPTSPSPSPNPSPEQNLVESPHCVDEQQVTQILGASYLLQSEQFFPEAQLLECKYLADQQVKNIFPTLSYTLRIHNPDALKIWQDQQAADQNKPAYRRIEENPALFADVNPVKELNQVTFYGHGDQQFLQLDYTPVKEEVGIELAKGRQLSELVLSLNVSPSK